MISDGSSAPTVCPFAACVLEIASLTPFTVAAKPSAVMVDVKTLLVGVT